MKSAQDSLSFGFFSRKIFHVLMIAGLGVIALLIPGIWVKPISVVGFIGIFVFEFVRINTGAYKIIQESVGALFKKKERLAASGLFWTAVSALIISLFANQYVMSYGFFLLGLSDPAGAFGGKFFKSKRIYRRKTIAGSSAVFIVATLVSLIFLYFLASISLLPLLLWSVALGLLVALIEIYSHPFDDNFTILLIATTAMHFLLKYLS